MRAISTIHIYLIWMATEVAWKSNSTYEDKVAITKEPRTQENLGKEMINIFKANHPDLKDWTWCPVLGQ